MANESSSDIEVMTASDEETEVVVIKSITNTKVDKVANPMIEITDDEEESNECDDEDDEKENRGFFHNHLGQPSLWDVFAIVTAIILLGISVIEGKSPTPKAFLLMNGHLLSNHTSTYTIQNPSNTYFFLYKICLLSQHKFCTEASFLDPGNHKNCSFDLESFDGINGKFIPPIVEINGYLTDQPTEKPSFAWESFTHHLPVEKISFPLQPLQEDFVI